MNKVQSIEPLIADKFNNELRSYNLDYKLEQESLNKEIDEALKNYASKSGGLGGNRPDVKLLLNTQDPNRRVPILIEYKGQKDKLVKLDKNKLVENFKDHKPYYKNIREYALNGALHYANAILHHTIYTECIAIGITGYKDDKGDIRSQIAVYYVNKSNLGMGIDVSKGEKAYSDLSFLSRKHFNDFIKRLDTLSLSDKDLERIREKKNQEIEDCLTRLNNDIYKKEKLSLSEEDRLYLVVASIIANLGISGISNSVAPLKKEDLKSSDEVHQRDGDIMLRKIQSFLEHKHLPQEKKQSIISLLEPLLRNENDNKAINGESRLKRCFSEIVDNLGIYYKIGLSTDFTGKLFNEMHRWLGFTQDQLNDVVLTPPYAATLLARLSKVNKDSFVWDFATGSAGLLVASMNLMIEDAKKCITSPEELEQKIVHIKAKQLLGIEKLQKIYILAVLNMILMGDGSSQILNQDSLSGFDGKVNDKEFKANAFVLNPPYSASGNGMVFVEQALAKMQSGYASVIIQSSAGSGKAKEYNVRILEKHTLLASIKMPSDLFIGKSSVQTHIYVFRVNEKHDAKQRVKFINFSNDGYARANRKKAKASHNLKDTHNAKERYNEVVDLVHIDQSCLKFLSEDDYYENTIDPKNGSDWNQNKPTDTKPKLEDFKRTIADYLSYEVGLILKNQTPPKVIGPLNSQLNAIKWGEFKLGDLFEIYTGSLLSQEDLAKGDIVRISVKSDNNGVYGHFDTLKNKKARHFENFISVNFFGNCFYHPYLASVEMKVHVLKLKNHLLTRRVGLFLANQLNKCFYGQFTYGTQLSSSKLKHNNFKIQLPLKPTAKTQTLKDIDFDFMEKFIAELEQCRLAELQAYLKASGLENTTLSNDEENALNVFNDKNSGGGGNTPCGLTWQHFKLGDLFEVLSSKKIYHANTIKIHDTQIENSYPYVVRAATNNGIKGFIVDDPTFANEKNTLSFAQDTFTVFYQKQPYFTGNKVKILKPKFAFKSPKILYFISAILQFILKPLTWGLGSTTESIAEFKFSLPLKPTANTQTLDGIDFHFMHTFINALMKQTIQGVAEYCSAKIQATKEVISQETPIQKDSLF